MTHATRLLYQHNNLPIFQNKMYDSYDAAISSPTGDVRLVEDLKTGLIRNEAFASERMIYDLSYQNEQGLSVAFKKHLGNVASLIIDNMGRDKIVEVGCGKGLFLQMLGDMGVDITGFDPAYEGSDERIRVEYFQPGNSIEGRGLILRHVLEHIQDPVAFLGQLKEANNHQGLIYIEVPCFDWIRDNRAWFDVFYEHVNYFRLSDFSRMFGSIKASGHVFGGQYLYAVADLSTLREPVYEPSLAVDMPADFALPLHHEKDEAPSIVWGGASKGVIFSLHRARMGAPVSAVVDINPAKQGKYLPITGIEVESPETVLSRLDKDSTIFVMNSNYLDEIKAMAGDTYRYVSIDRIAGF